MKTRSVLLVTRFFGVLALSTSSAIAAPIFNQEFACYKALSEVSKGRDLSTFDQSRLMVPARRFGKEGFYIYTADTSYFQELASKPDKQDDSLKFYYFKHENAFLTYSKDDSPEGLATNVVQDNPQKFLPGDKNKYKAANPKDALDDASKDSLNQELINRIGSISDVYQFNKKLVGPQGLSSKDLRAFEEKARSALSVCGKLKSDDIKEAVRNERTQLPTGSDQTKKSSSGASSVK